MRKDIHDYRLKYGLSEALRLLNSMMKPQDEVIKQGDREAVIKDSNPKDAVGVRKAPLSTVPIEVLFEVGLGMLEGSRIYGRHNYRAIGVRASVYFDAVMRHLAAWWEGEDIDPDSDLHHLVKAICCLVVARDAQINGKFFDDRPPSIPSGWLLELNKKAGEMIDRHPDAVEPYIIDKDNK